MHTFFLICAGAGVAFLTMQFLAGALGFLGDHDSGDSGDGDGDSDHGENWFLGLLTFRSLCAAVAFFGLGGLSAAYYNLEPAGQLGTAFAAGFVALYLVASLMKLLYRLKADGTVQIADAVGQTGTVYLRIPAHRTGPGKVTLCLQGRTVELEAMTADEELPTGTPIRVVAVVGPSAVEVVHLHAPSEV